MPRVGELNNCKIYKLVSLNNPELVDYAKKRMGVTDEIYEKVMNSPPKSWHDYPTYKKRFEQLRPIFGWLAEANLVPMSFYLKYCFPQ